MFNAKSQTVRGSPWESLGVLGSNASATPPTKEHALPSPPETGRMLPRPSSPAKRARTGAQPVEEPVKHRLPSAYRSGALGEAAAKLRVAQHLRGDNFVDGSRSHFVPIVGAPAPSPPCRIRGARMVQTHRHTDGRGEIHDCSWFEDFVPW